MVEGAGVGGLFVAFIEKECVISSASMRWHFEQQSKIEPGSRTLKTTVVATHDLRVDLRLRRLARR